MLNADWQTLTAAHRTDFPVVQGSLIEWGIRTGDGEPDSEVTGLHHEIDVNGGKDWLDVSVTLYKEDGPEVFYLEGKPGETAVVFRVLALPLGDIEHVAARILQAAATAAEPLPAVVEILERFQDEAGYRAVDWSSSSLFC